MTATATALVSAAIPAPVAHRLSCCAVDWTLWSVIPSPREGGGAVVAWSLNRSDYNGSSSCRGSLRQ